MIELIKPWHGLLTFLSYVAVTVYHSYFMIRVIPSNYLGLILTLIFMLLIWTYTTELRRDRDRKILIRMMRVFTLFVLVGMSNIILSRVETSFIIFTIVSFTTIILFILFGACVYGFTWIVGEAYASWLTLAFGLILSYHARKQFRLI